MAQGREFRTRIGKERGKRRRPRSPPHSYTLQVKLTQICQGAELGKSGAVECCVEVRPGQAL